MRTFSTAVLVLSFALGGIGCDAGGGGAGAAVVRDSAGVEIVSNRVAAGWSAEDAPSFVEELRIGTLEGDPNYMFGRIMGIDVDEDGRIYAVDMQAKLVRVFDPDGGFAHAFGRSGQGPGEFVTPMMIVTLKDEIRVLDASGLRVQRFDRTGRELDRERLDNGMVVAVRLPDDSEYLEWRKPSPTMSAAGAAVLPDELIVRRSLAGDRFDTIVSIPAAQSVSIEGGTIRMRLNAPTPIWAVAGDRVLVAQNTEFRIEERSLEGDLTRIFSLDVEPTAVTPERKEELLKRVAGVGSLVSSTEVLPYNPVINTLAAGPENTRWVYGRDSRYPADESKFLWYVFNGEGRYLGALEVPPGFTPLVARHDRLYGVESDELGVQYIVRYRVEGL